MIFKLFSLCAPTAQAAVPRPGDFNWDDLGLA